MSEGVIFQASLCPRIPSQSRWPGLTVHLDSSYDHSKESITKKMTDETLGAKRQIAHFPVVCLVTWPLSQSEAGVEFVSIQTSVLFKCK